MNDVQPAHLTPSSDQLERSPMTEKRSVGGELRYYVKDLQKHLAALNADPNPDLEAWFTPDGKFHAGGVKADHQRALLGAMMGAVA